SGELADGTLLPSHEELLQEFDISMPSLREALRILETEGLIGVRRGRYGGVRIRRPAPDKAAYQLALVLQSRDVSLGDVLQAIEDLEPLCAASCARRRDRETAVLPRLRATLDAAKLAVDDAVEYAALARQFHQDIVASCGNQTMVIVAGALEELWGSHVERLVHHADQLGPFADREMREQTIDEHE